MGITEQDFEALFKEYFIGLTAFGKKYVKDTDAAKEIVHDVFVNLWKKRETIDPEKSLKSYLFTSVYNRSLNFIRDKKKFNTSMEVEEIENVHFTTEDNQKMEAAELEQKIHAILEELPIKCKTVFMLSRFEGKKYKEIAEELKISPKTVEVHMSKALRALRSGLSNYLTAVALTILDILFLQ